MPEAETQRFTRQELYELVWREPIEKLAPKFGLSDRGLGKLCERHAIPTPPRGYWARKQAGQKPPKAPLIALAGERPLGPIASFRTKRDAQPDAADPLLAFFHAQCAEIGAIPVAKTLRNPHPMIGRWIEEDKRRRAQHAKWGGAFLALDPDTPLERRRLRLLSALYQALEARGVRIHCAEPSRTVTLRHGSDELRFTLREYVQQKRRPVSESERAHDWAARAYRVEQTPSGRLRGKIDTYLTTPIPSAWTETEEKPFESLLGEIAAAILASFADAQGRRDAREEIERRQREAREAERQREAEREAERARVKALCDRAGAWRAAADLRAFIGAVEAAIAAGRLNAPPDEFQSWSAWARAKADALDPLIAGDALQTGPR